MGFFVDSNYLIITAKIYKLKKVTIKPFFDSNNCLETSLKYIS